MALLLVGLELSPTFGADVRCFSGVLTYSSELAINKDYRLELGWKLLIDDVRWRIVVATKADQTGERVEVGSDGSTTFSVNYLKPFAPGRPTKSNDSIAVIESGAMPWEAFLTVHPVWLALCAPHLLKLLPGQKMPSLDQIGGAECAEARVAKFEYRYVMLPQSKYFRSFELFDDGYSRNKLEDGRFLVVRRDPPYDKGYVMTRLLVDETKEFDGLRLPTRSIYERLRPSGAIGASVSVVDRWVMTVNSTYVTNLGTTFWLPQPTGNTDVQDRRYAQESPPVFSLDYRLKGRSWPVKGSPFLMRLYEAGAGINGRPERKPGNRRVVVYVLAGVSAVAFLLVLWRTRLSSK